ncbi:hypothetical protein B0A49_07912 [Cryomyces minteri]|uniref:Uncharacterized protein n=1 Tax=Cryomyces minteri TaxID=331657 RepID=A0A4U0WFD7_9PEZI|nr:hypothetical protein B0A49_07912 [Cryomyces minteri]
MYDVRADLPRISAAGHQRVTLYVHARHLKTCVLFDPDLAKSGNAKSTNAKGRIDHQRAFAEMQKATGSIRGRTQVPDELYNERIDDEKLDNDRHTNAVGALDLA